MGFSPEILALLLIMGAAALAILHTVAGVLRTESAFWDIRCEVERLRYKYQLQLMRVAKGEIDPEDIGEVDILDDGPAEPIEVGEALPGE
ncbi:MAG: hypothetical protein ACF8Q5_13800 [Phycisphaerales bacterium JB040]